MGCGGSKEGTQASQPQQTPVEKPKKTTEEPKESAKATPPVTVTVEDAPDSTKEEFSEFEQTSLRHHNEYRALHGCAPLRLSRGLCDVAQGWADHLAANKSFEHSQDRDYQGQAAGENLYMTASSAPDVNGDGATKSWYDEIKDYNWDKPEFAMSTGHFTQVVWKGSTELGVASSVYENDGWHNMLVVANYSEAGNMMGAFEENVPKLV